MQNPGASFLKPLIHSDLSIFKTLNSKYAQNHFYACSCQGSTEWSISDFSKTQDYSPKLLFCITSWKIISVEPDLLLIFLPSVFILRKHGKTLPTVTCFLILANLFVSCMHKEKSSNVKQKLLWDRAANLKSSLVQRLVLLQTHGNLKQARKLLDQWRWSYGIHVKSGSPQCFRWHTSFHPENGQPNLQLPGRRCCCSAKNGFTKSSVVQEAADATSLGE